jgi:hypothetical protein
LDPCVSLTVVCVVLVFWQWKNDLISLSAFLYLVFWQWKNDLISCLHFCIGILAMEKRIDFMSAFLYWYPGMEKRFYLLFMSALYWYSGNGKMI